MTDANLTKEDDITQYTEGLSFRRSIWITVALVLASLAAAISTASAASQGPAPAPEDLRLVLDQQGFVDRLDWSPPADGSEPSRYDVNYRFGGEDPATAQVFWSTTDTSLKASESFGRFVECTPDHHPSDQWIVWITYSTSSGESLPSEQITMCFP